jgi:hypothetical protein
MQIPLEPCDSDTRPPGCNSGTQPAGPPKETGSASNGNAPRPGALRASECSQWPGGGALPVEQNPGTPGRIPARSQRTTCTSIEQRSHANSHFGDEPNRSRAP